MNDAGHAVPGYSLGISLPESKLSSRHFHSCFGGNTAVMLALTLRRTLLTRAVFLSPTHSDVACLSVSRGRVSQSCCSRNLVPQVRITAEPGIRHGAQPELGLAGSLRPRTKLSWLFVHRQLAAGVAAVSMPRQAARRSAPPLGLFPRLLSRTRHTDRNSPQNRPRLLRLRSASPGPPASAPSRSKTAFPRRLLSLSQ